MYFTEGRLRTYERMMQEKPKQGHGIPAKLARDRNCKQCRYFDKHNRKCSKEKCILPDD